VSRPLGDYQGVLRTVYEDYLKTLVGARKGSAIGHLLLPSWEELQPEAKAVLEVFYKRGRLDAALFSRRESANDIRVGGWSVAVHNDYRLNGKSYTFWLFTKGQFAVKGEGRTDGEALDMVRIKIARLDKGLDKVEVARGRK
jgi:hypothetical protein